MAVTPLARGQRTELGALGLDGTAVELRLHAVLGDGAEADWSCFAVDAAGTLADDRWFVFYNQPSSPGGAVARHVEAGGTRLAVSLDALPAWVDRLVVTASVDPPATFAGLAAGRVELAGAGEVVAAWTPEATAFGDEQAIVALELYRRGGGWRLAIVGQGFAGGLPALLAHFGGEQADGPVAPAEPVAPAGSGAATAPTPASPEVARVVDLAKRASVSLAKHGLDRHVARVVLALDISLSMRRQYESGRVQRLAERVLALATQLDDDGVVDVFLFAGRAYHLGPLSLRNVAGFTDELLSAHPLEGGTRYGAVLELVRRTVLGAAGARATPLAAEVPVYALVLTDGQTGTRQHAIDQVVQSSLEPIFWQFVGIGGSSFGFLHELDDLPGRHVDNAGFFAVPDLDAIADDELYARMVDEYPRWVATARAGGLLTR